MVYGGRTHLSRRDVTLFFITDSTRTPSRSTGEQAKMRRPDLLRVVVVATATTSSRPPLPPKLPEARSGGYHYTSRSVRLLLFASACSLFSHRQHPVAITIRRILLCHHQADAQDHWSETLKKKVRKIAVNERKIVTRAAPAALDVIPCPPPWLLHLRPPPGLLQARPSKPLSLLCA